MTHEIDETKLSSDLKDALLERGHSDADISSMSPEKAFDEFCMWHGLIGWGPRLRDAMESAKSASNGS